MSAYYYNKLGKLKNLIIDNNVSFEEWKELKEDIDKEFNEKINETLLKTANSEPPCNNKEFLIQFQIFS